MRRTLLAAAVFGAPLLLTLAFIGCGPPQDKGPSETTTDNSGGPKGATTSTSGPLKPLEAKAGATLKGRVTLKGKEPDLAALTQQLQAIMKGKPDQMTACFDMAPDAEKSEQVWKIGKDNGVGNVVVWIQPPADYYFKSDPAKPTWKMKVEPEAAALRVHPARQLGSPGGADRRPEEGGPQRPAVLRIQHRRGIPQHEVVERGGANEGELPPLPPNTPPQEVKLTGNNQMVHFQCNIHPWMDAWVLVFNHPYADVTDGDGNYEIKNVPVGSKMRVTAWHEKGPYNNFLTPAKIKGDEIEIKDGDNEHNFDFEYKE